MSKAAVVAYAMSFLGTPYSYGGDGPWGIDCSGLVIEVMKSVGVLPPHFRTSAHELYKTLGTMGHPHVSTCEEGAIAFFGLPQHISHVAICKDDQFIIEAGGGSSSVITLDDAKKTNSFVRIRPLSIHKDLIGFILPNY